MTRIAVADDDTELRALIADLLRDNGHDVVEAGDGASLLALLHRGGISLVISDLWMPRLTGSDVLQLRRSSGDTTPFIIITAAPPPFAEPLRSTEWVTVVYKPFNEAAILDAVNQRLTHVIAATATVAAAAALDRDHAATPDDEPTKP
ncbi:MAG TPA: response regulator [Kofleriaceae bacterium]|jgi:DNA-binding NtrC family response regulator|nr:response regulator [Kofleriaceae bacterium]